MMMKLICMFSSWGQRSGDGAFVHSSALAFSVIQEVRESKSITEL